MPGKVGNDKGRMTFVNAVFFAKSGFQLALFNKLDVENEQTGKKNYNEYR